MSDLPSGTVTFLFTDIEGSTALWEKDRPAMAVAVERHISLLDAAIQAHGGIHFKTVGDAVQAAFPAAPQAVEAALDGQRSLLAEDWGEVGPLKVRMAVHAGEAIPDARGDYLAAPLNRLSRLLSTGYGSQIPLSQTVQQLTRGALPPNAELRDLGEHRLRDLLEPERAFQLLHQNLPVHFPPLKSLETRPNNLPRQPTPFLGREREVAAVVELLGKEDVQLLALVGPGGTGKTRLALQAAAELLDEFADGVFFVPLASLADPDLVTSAIATALGVHEEGGQPLRTRLQHHMATKQLLLVLDNVEHLVEAAPRVGEFFAAAPGLKVLATSRVPLRLRAEREYAVPPLGLPRRKPPPPPEQLSQYEAVRFFIERAQAVKRDFAVDNENAPAIAEICHRLDGLPLAIELAAARIRMLPPQALLTRLEQRLPMLTGGARDAPERQRTLRNTIAWSYDLLEPEEQILFRRLAVFAGGATFEAIEAVANAEGQLEVFGGLERLVEHNLLRQQEAAGEPRFTMLETVREFGLERLDEPGEAAALAHRHACWCLTFAEQGLDARGSDEPAWLARLEAEHDNLRAALTWAVGSDEAELALRLVGALVRFWEMRGHFGEGRAWADRALAVPGEAPPLVRAMAFNAAGELEMWTGDFARAEALFGEGLILVQAAEDRYGTWLLLRNLGQVARSVGDYQTAVGWFEKALAVAREDSHHGRVANVVLGLGELAARMGDRARGIALLDEALEISRSVDDPVLGAIASASMGDIALDEVDAQQAATRYGESLATSADLGDQIGVASGLWGVAAAALAAGNPPAAARLLGAEAALVDDLGVAIPPADRAVRNRLVHAAREVLGGTNFAAAWETGRSRPTEEVVAEALLLAEALALTRQISDPAG